jgi:glycosyltransferase 2 family protein
MKRALDFFWPALGIVAVLAAFWLLAREFRGEAVRQDVMAALRAIPPHRYLMAGLATLVAYAALAWYDRIALLHLGVKHISWTFVSLCSFTTYALSHNIGASVFSGAMVRYRAYSTKGMSAAQIAVLVALCSFTFFLGTVLLGGLVLVFEPEQLARLKGLLPAGMTNPTTAILIGLACLSVVVLYVIGSILRFKPRKIGNFKIEYPRPEITMRQLIAAPAELLGAAGIIYFALPPEAEVSFFVVVAVFLASFSAGLVSNAPGGLGVFELVFIKALPLVAKSKVLAALLVFRLFYLLIPLAFALVVVLVFERRRLVDTLHEREAEAPAQADRSPD